MDAERRRVLKWWNLSITCIIFAAIFLLLSHTKADPDLWGHVKFGGDIVETRSIVRTDTYSYLSEPGEWINHELLAEVLFHFAFTLAGAAGLVALKLSVGLAALLVVYFFLLRRGLRPVVACVILLIVAGFSRPVLVTVRPQLFTFLFLTSVTGVISAYSYGILGSLWLVIPIFALWPNFHGGFLAGMAVLGLWFFVHSVTLVIRTRQAATLFSSTWLKDLGFVLAAMLAVFLNPYGPKLLEFLLRTATIPRPEIGDWQSIPLVSALGALYMILVALTLTGLLYSRRERPPALLAVYTSMAILPLTAVRHLPLFAVSAALISGEHMQDAWDRGRSYLLKPQPSTLRPRLAFVFAGTSFIIALGMLGLAAPQLSCIQLPKDFYAVRAIDIIDEVVPAGNLVVHFDWGEYAIWRLGPQIKVSVDGRRETVYSREIYQQNMHFMTGTEDWDELVDAHKTDIVLVPAGRASYNLMLLKPGWVKVYQDPLAALFVPQDSPFREPIQSANSQVLYDGAGTCFH